MSKKIVIIGASGFGREVVWLIGRINQVAPEWDLLGFLDDDTQKKGLMIGGYPILGNVLSAADYPDSYFVCAVGSANVREGIIGRISNMFKARYATLIDPSVLFSESVQIGEGSIICAQTILTVDITIGRHVIINLDCTVGHDTVISDFCTLYPNVNVSGNVQIGKYTELGTGMQIIQGKRIGTNCIVGAGATVVRDIDVPGIYAGVPAKRLEET